MKVSVRGVPARQASFHTRCPTVRRMSDHAADDNLILKPDDDGQLFLICVLSSGEEHVALYCYRALNGWELQFPMFYDPERPGDYTRWVHVGWDAVAVRRLQGLTEMKRGRSRISSCDGPLPRPHGIAPPGPSLRTSS